MCHSNKYLLIAILVRLLLIPFFYHPDIKSQNYHFQFLSQGQLNIYQFISDNKTHLPYRDTFNYLPLTYFTFGTLQAILKPVLPSDFTLWLNDWGGTQYNFANLPYFLLILKIPYIILDISLAFLLYKISSSKKLFYFWLFNPFSFYLIYVIENFDIFPVFLTVLAYYWLRSKPSLSFLIFGLAISLKLYPVIFLPFFLFYQNKNPDKIAKYALITSIPVIVSVLPFAFNQSFWQSFFGSGLTQKIIELKFYNLPVFPLVYISILIFYLFSKKKDLPYQIFLIFLLFISTVNFHPQWLLWFLPFIFLLKSLDRPSIYIPLLIISFLIFAYIFLFNDNYLTWGHLIPIDPKFLSISSPYEIIRNRFIPEPQLIQNYIKSIIAFASIFSVILYEKNHTHHLS